MIKRFIKIICLLIISLAFSSKSRALEYKDSFNEGEWIKGEYVIKDNGNPKDKKYQQLTLIKRNSDNHFVYCLESTVKLKTGIYTGYDENQDIYANISKEAWQRIELLAYYGYGYKNHTDIKWYVITQYLIWKTVPHGYDIYFTDKLNGKRINKYEEEIEELNSLVSNHLIKPNINIENDLILNNDYTFNDSNNILDKYEIVDNKNVNISIINNTLEVTPIGIGKGLVKLERKTYLDKKAIVYVDTDSQDVMVRGGVTPVEIEYNFNIKKNIQIKKIDMDSKDTLLIKGIKFKIWSYDSNNYICINSDCTFETRADGLTNNITLEEGEYRLEEVNQLIEGYLWNSNTYDFNVSLDSESIITMPNKKVMGKIIIEKVGEKLVVNDNTYYYEKIPLDNVSFNLYADTDIYSNNKLIYKKDDLVGTYYTKNGLIEIDNLLLGKYYIKEKDTIEGYILDEERYDISLEYINQYTDIVTKNIKIENKLEKGNLEILKLDMESLDYIEGALIEVWNTDKNILIFKGYSKDKESIMLNDLPIGNYKIKEVLAPCGYILNNLEENIYINNGDTIITKIFNKKEGIGGVDEEKKIDIELEIIEVPDTFLDNYELFKYIIINGILLISLLVIYEKKN